MKKKLHYKGKSLKDITKQMWDDSTTEEKLNILKAQLDSLEERVPHVMSYLTPMGRMQ